VEGHFGHSSDCRVRKSNAQGIKAFAANGDIAGFGMGRLKLSPIDWDSLIKALGISEMEPLDDSHERKLWQSANGHPMPLRRNDDVCDLRLAPHFELRTGRQPAPVRVSLLERFEFSGLARRSL
jgi:hypothetical protein